MKRTKILPVYPAFPQTFWTYDKIMRYTGKKALMPPTGLATIAAMLPKDQFEVSRIIDLNVEELRDEQIENADLVLTSTMVVQEDSHNQIIERAHSMGKKVVAGGPSPTLYPERNIGADYMVGGEGEVTLPRFLYDFLRGNPKAVYEQNGQKPDLKQSPVPRWDLLDLDKYYFGLIQYSRGCPSDCEFCSVPGLFGKGIRTKSPEQPIRELDVLYATGFRGAVFIADDNFIGNKREVRQFLQRLGKWQKAHNHPFTFQTEASIDLGWSENKGILESMVDAGFNEVFLGIETVDLDILKGINKKKNVKVDQLKAIRNIQYAGLPVTGGFILGFDDEKPDTADKLYEFIQEAGIPISMSGLLLAGKGSRLYDRLEKEGRLRETDYGANTHNLSLNFDPMQDEKELLDKYVGLLEKLFDDKNYYNRCRTLQKNMNRPPAARGERINPLGWYAKVLAKTLGDNLFRPGGIECMRYLSETLVRNPRYFNTAVADVLKLSHFREITEETVRDYRREQKRKKEKKEKLILFPSS